MIICGVCAIKSVLLAPHSDNSRIPTSFIRVEERYKSKVYSTKNFQSLASHSFKLIETIEMMFQLMCQTTIITTCCNKCLVYNSTRKQMFSNWISDLLRETLSHGLGTISELMAGCETRPASMTGRAFWQWSFCGIASVSHFPWNNLCFVIPKHTRGRQAAVADFEQSRMFIIKRNNFGRPSIQISRVGWHFHYAGFCANESASLFVRFQYLLSCFYSISTIYLCV